MSATTRRRNRGTLDTSSTLIFGAIGLAVVLIGGIWVSVHVGYWLGDIQAVTVANPISLAVGIGRGNLTWPTTSTVTAAILLLLLVVALYFGIRFTVTIGSTRSFDRAARFLATGKELQPITERGVREKAKHLGVTVDSPGVPLGRTVVGGVPIYTSWEDVAVIIAGARTGKSTSMVIPAIAAAPGAVVSTSNKRDVVDATRGIRQTKGDVWVFDPQSLADEPPSWWWDPLTFVTNEVKAGQLARVFSDASRPDGAVADAFFDPSAEMLIAGFLHAAALDGLPLGHLHHWLFDTTNDDAVFILERYGETTTADSIRAIIAAPEKQKGGIYGTAQKIMGFLINADAMHWVEPGTLFDQRAEFSPAEFVRSTGTLYMLSKEGAASTGPLVTALTVAVCEAAEEYAKTQPGGRLAEPLLLMLDEAANICRWAELPNLYSHYGSRGIIIFTILQSWPQGVAVWGESGMRKLWGAANARIYLGGTTDIGFLTDLSALIGDHQISTSSTSRSTTGTTTSHQIQSERILDPSDLAAMPINKNGRAIVFYSGMRPVIIRTVPWMNTSHAPQIRESIARAHATSAPVPLVTT